MKIKSFSDINFAKDPNRVEKLDEIVNEWLSKNEDIDIQAIQRSDDGNSYITICYIE